MARRFLAGLLLPLFLLVAIGCTGSEPESPKVKEGSGPTLKPVTPSMGGKPAKENSTKSE